MSLSYDPTQSAANKVFVAVSVHVRSSAWPMLLLLVGWSPSLFKSPGTILHFPPGLFLEVSALRLINASRPPSLTHTHLANNNSFFLSFVRWGHLLVPVKAETGVMKGGAAAATDKLTRTLLPPAICLPAPKIDFCLGNSGGRPKTR